MPTEYSPSKAIQVTEMEEIMFATGSYIGDGGMTKAITGVGFKPDGVDIWDAGTDPAAVHSTKVSSLGSQDFRITATAVFLGKWIFSYDPDGFTVDIQLNADGITHYFRAWKA